MRSPHGRAIRVLIVDDSAVVRGVLGRLVDAEPDMRVVTTASNGRDALDALRLHAADVVLLDIEMPVMDGFAALPLITARHPTVKVLVTSSRVSNPASAERVLSLGAVDVVHKPSARAAGVGGVTAAAAEMITKIRTIANDGHRTAIKYVPAESRAPRESERLEPAAVGPAEGTSDDFRPQVVALAASTGGPNALATVLSQLPSDFALPVLVTQHMPPIFTTMFAQRISREGKLPCSEARSGERLLPGHIYIAPGDHHLVVTGGSSVSSARLEVNQDAPEHHCRPAADPMFRSLAQVFGERVLGIVLTGMGEDGREGCRSIVAAGGRVAVQDAATSVVWGMPGSVVTAGIPCSILPLNAMSAHISSLCRAR